MDGKVRVTQISKDGFSFSNIQYIYKSLKSNAVHPFYKGSGRTARSWLDDMLRRNISKLVDWNNIGEREYLETMRKSYVNIAYVKKTYLKNLTDRLYDRQVFFYGIDSSYYYEGMYEFTSEEITKDIHEEKL